MGKSKKRRNLVWLAAGAVVFVSAAYWTFGSGPSTKTVLETAPVEFGDLTVELPATGTIDAVNVIEVGAAVSGRIKALYVDFNDRVKAGQLLAEIEDDDFRGAYLQAKADLTAAQAAIEVVAANVQSARDDQARAAAFADRARSLYEKTRLDLERYQKLRAEDLATQAAFEKVQAGYLTAKADGESAAALVEQAATKVKSSQAAVEQARATAAQRTARLAAVKRNLDYCRITSPVNGVVVSRNMDAGQTVAARLQAPSLFNIAEDLSHMYVYTKLDSSDVSKVRPGLPATFTVNAFKGETFEGKLIQVRINANAEAPVSRANPTGQFQRTITAGVSAGSPVSNDPSSAGGGGSSGSSAGGSSGSGGGGRPSSGGLPTTTSTTSPSSGPPTASRNTVVVYDALIEFRNPEEKLLPGMTAYVTIPISSVKGTLKVPSAALRFSPNIPDEEKQRLLEAIGIRADEAKVWVVAGEKKFRPARVKPLLTDYVYTAVQSDDLKPGMQVATRIVERKAAS